MSWPQASIITTLSTSNLIRPSYPVFLQFFFKSPRLQVCQGQTKKNWWLKLHPYICTTTTTTNKTLFNSCERLLLGTLIEHRNWSQKPQIRTSLTLSTNKQGTDQGTLVVLFDQTFHPLHKYTSLHWDSRVSINNIEVLSYSATSTFCHFECLFIKLWLSLLFPRNRTVRKHLKLHKNALKEIICLLKWSDEINSLLGQSISKCWKCPCFPFLTPCFRIFPGNHF